MKIAKISIKNCLGIEELEFNPTDLTLIEGRSKSGKTSIIDSITQFLTNKGERPDFVHEGAKKGEVLIEFDNGLKGKKVFKPNGKPSSVSLEKDGMQPKAAETFLKSLFNPYQINPIDFIKKSPKEQTETILNCIPMELSAEKIIEYFGENLVGDTSDMHALKVAGILEKKYFDLRKESNSQIKYFTSDIEVIDNKLPLKYDVEKWRTVNLSDIVGKINDANENNKYVANCNKLISEADSKKESLKAVAESQKESLKVSFDAKKQMLEDKISQIKEEIKRMGVDFEADIKSVESTLKTDIECLEEKASKSKEWLKSNSEIDISELQKELEETEKAKSFIGLADDLEKKKGWLESEIKTNEDLKNKLEISRALPQQLIKSAKLPIDEMDIDSSGNITIKNRPIANLSGAERLEFAIKIAKLTSGELKTILINGFEALDSEMKKQFMDNASKDTDYQYIIADVTDGDLEIK